MKMYHGSLANIKDEFLRVHKPFETYFYPPAVYLSQKKELAILHALNPIRIYALDRNIADRANAFSCHFRNVLDKKVITICECYEGMFDELFKHEVYLYSVEVNEEVEDYDDFAYPNDIKYQSKEVISNTKEFLQACEKEGMLRLIKFGDLSEREKYHLFESLESRANACENEVELQFFREKFADNKNIQRKLRLNKI